MICCVQLLHLFVCYCSEGNKLVLKMGGALETPVLVTLMFFFSDFFQTDLPFLNKVAHYDLKGSCGNSIELL